MPLHFANLIGWVAMLLLAWAVSYHRKKFPWRTVIWGLGLQLTLAILILKTPWGHKLFEFAGKVILKLIQFSTEGTQFVFGSLADPAAMDRLVQALVARMGDQVLREIAWEIMPDLAERLRLKERP